ncbi:MAG: hypothetical protein A2402_03535 [Candidatus Staskawiczbacteria bacterium RIFOXYC1_FULL_37_43]|nr:MAG: hypothetical protein A2813_02625 [Candidatus Staskawiczbacteria bacterium RIFCSPHIGHO2_01_FULL_37_17]OGZ71824.1 MAG: hypothetical protein A2891_01860 [Candidatus Staskawiczbacteria bacterium RIFCSPLOWO2_01_FULL_37_19]OGZ75715.1 MAG: hypothetical protein A2205_02455 [Candidatus Staskawiczbacteria bacterium RIFOXYA1_FULL_37_15]OGZ77234.1 MAG: hypothetical protein A2280_02350 [Candidatus Staskawiczbacteria bacterium RIFOXYA12_FULL_37_10]OGZ80605.1 MAG: hypothetical protein A2353_00135 [Can
MEEKFLNPVRKLELSNQDSVFKNNEKETQSKNRLSNGVKLTNTVYSLLAFFPESDPIKNKAKDKALSIMEGLTLFARSQISKEKQDIQSQILEDIAVLLNYFKVAKSQGWISNTNYLIVSNEYEKIEKDIALSASFQQKQKIAPEGIQTPIESRPPKVSRRQNKILKFLEGNETAQVMDLQKVLPNITKRTIRRDLDELLESGRIVRMGEFNQVFYKINR